MARFKISNINFRWKLLLGFFPVVVFSASNGIVACGLTLVLSIFSSIVLARFITHPILKIEEEIKEISVGNFEKRIEVVPNDEIGTLSQNVNQMVDVLQTSNRLPQSILLSMRDSLLVINNEGLIDEMNQSALDLLGYTKEEVVGKPISFLFAKTPVKRSNPLK